MYIYGKANKVTIKTQVLTELVVSIIRLYPEAVTKNRYKTDKLPLNKTNRDKYQRLYRMLVHTSTMINKNYRMQDEGGYYLTETEDHINALELMKELIMYFDVRKTAFEHEILTLLSVRYPHQKEFTRKDFDEVTGYSTRQSNRILSTLKDKGLIEMVSQSRRYGNRYRLTKPAI